MTAPLTSLNIRLRTSKWLTQLFDRKQCLMDGPTGEPRPADGEKTTAAVKICSNIRCRSKKQKLAQRHHFGSRLVNLLCWWAAGQSSDRDHQPQSITLKTGRPTLTVNLTGAPCGSRTGQPCEHLHQKWSSNSISSDFHRSSAWPKWLPSSNYRSQMRLDCVKPD